MLDVEAACFYPNQGEGKDRNMSLKNQTLVFFVPHSFQAAETDSCSGSDA